MVASDDRMFTDAIVGIQKEFCCFTKYVTLNRILRSYYFIVEIHHSECDISCSAHEWKS